MSIFNPELNAARARSLSAQGLARMKQEELNGALEHIVSQAKFNAESVEHVFIDHFPETISELVRRGFTLTRKDENEWPEGTRYTIAWGKKKERRQPPE